MNACPLCSVQMTNRPWMDAEHAIALAADAAATDGHTLVVPKEHVANIHALPVVAQKEIWSPYRQKTRSC